MRVEDHIASQARVQRLSTILQTLTDPELRQWVEDMMLQILSEDETLLLKLKDGDEALRQRIKGMIMQALFDESEST